MSLSKFDTTQLFMGAAASATLLGALIAYATSNEKTSPKDDIDKSSILNDELMTPQTRALRDRE